ncbi:MAG: DUF6596 domain-containing protein [Hyphomicrobiales bacterium]
MTNDDARRRAEAAARVSYGRLVALLSARTRDIAAAEDALADAFLAALETWPARGVPANPDAWLLTAARNAAASRGRKTATALAAMAELERRSEERMTGGDFPDERLKLLFVCAHPAIDSGVRTPLMLQSVLGLDAARIARAFLVPAATMSQRLVRAKVKIRDAGIRFAVPDPDALEDRLEDVLAAVYAAYGTGWDALGGADEHATGLAQEAIYLARLIVSLLPAEPEAKGLLSLMLHCEARHAARRGVKGTFVSLDRQDVSLWDRELIAEAEQLLAEASRHRRFGRFQCEAAIQSMHVQRGITGTRDLDALQALYDLLWQRTGSLGAAVGRSAVLIERNRPADALAALDALPPEKTERYQPCWVVRAKALTALDRGAHAADALTRAIDLTDDPAVRAFLVEERETLAIRPR